jgi:two-component system, OmpR family, response regulator ResD
MNTSLPRVLLVEDERAHQLIIQKSLSGFYHIEMAVDVASAHKALASGNYDLFLLDIMLPDGTGFDVLSELRKNEKHRLTPVIFLTVREDLKAKLMGFSLGADDYVVKPAEPLELRARIDAKLRKMHELGGAQSATFIHIGDMVIDLNRQVVQVSENNQMQTLDLTPLEFKLLLFFARHAGQAMSRAKILEAVWGNSTHVLDRSVDSYVAALRRKLGRRAALIKSVHGVGYRLEVNQDKQRSA